MKKRYELIKEYPNSPPVGSIIYQEPGTNIYFWGGLKICCPGKYPEFWKEQKYVFTTEDGVDIHEGDEYWVISPNLITPHKTNANIKFYIADEHNNNRKFSSEKAAKVALKEEKEKLSVEYHEKDMLNVIRLASEMLDVSKDFDLDVYTPFSTKDCEAVLNYYLNNKEKCNHYSFFIY